MNLSDTAARWLAALILVLMFAIIALVLGDIAIFLGGTVGIVLVSVFNELLDWWF